MLYTVLKKLVKLSAFTSKLPLYIVSTLKAGPKAEPEGLFPRGFPPKIVLPPLGTIEKRVTLAEYCMIYSIAKSASYF